MYTLLLILIGIAIMYIFWFPYFYFIEKIKNERYPYSATYELTPFPGHHTLLGSL